MSETPTPMSVPPGMLSPVIAWIGSCWCCEWKHPSGAGMGMMGLGDTPDEAYANWFEANTPRWAPGTSPWHLPDLSKLPERLRR